MNASRAPDPSARISRPPVGNDPQRPMVARIYNAFLGGNDHYQVEQQVIGMLKAVPDASFVFTSEIEFLQRAVRHVAARSITQWVVALAGLLPEHVDRIDQTIRVVDVDPLNATAVWDSLTIHVTPIEGGPVCLVLGGVLSYHPGTRADAAAVVQQHIARLPPGSFVVLTHLYVPEDTELASIVRRFRDAMGSHGAPHPDNATRDQIRAMVAGTTILEPGPGKPREPVPANLWWRDGPLYPSEPASGALVAGVVAAVGSG